MKRMFTMAALVTVGMFFALISPEAMLTTTAEAGNAESLVGKRMTIPSRHGGKIEIYLKAGGRIVASSTDGMGNAVWANGTWTFHVNCVRFRFGGGWSNKDKCWSLRGHLNQ